MKTIPQSADTAALVNDIQALESRAQKLGMYITARGLNNAKNAFGWELAGDVARAANAAIGIRS